MNTTVAVRGIAAICVLCGAASGEPAKPSRATMTALYTAVAIKVDGVLDEPVWAAAESYPLSLSADRLARGDQLQEHGTVRLAWDDEFLYVAIAFQDEDIVAEADVDQEHHYRFGDVAEVFLKPTDSTWYWELYATPKGHKSSFWYPSRGYLGLPSPSAYRCGLQVAAHCQGTLNHWQDRDHLWTAEFAMPIRDLTAHGDRFGPGAAWRILVARYNFGRYLTAAELSMTPMLSMSVFNLHDEYADLLLEKP